ncbi:co-chaperone DjlA [Hahella sp. SMD15-11]|uniref:Co-chaperone protein DjlA n=1 Tax=Thermohahella caldifontis TaxID=3142973 RepID=A0AB39UUX4_9GAMM
MSWWGKVLGGSLGWALGGPLGALIGAALGHTWDRGLSDMPEWAARENVARQERIQAAFFTALFGVLGHLAKADGRVSKDEIDAASQIMDQLGLDTEQRAFARNLFREGKSPDFDLDAVLTQFRAEAGRRVSVNQAFMEALLVLALADGELHPGEQAILLRVADALGFSRFQFEALLAMVVARQGYRYHQYQGYSERHVPEPDIRQAYQVLGVEETASDDEIRKAYRRLISQHHPDRLIARGVPEEMIRLANEQTARIREAYEQIRAHRKRRH